MIVPFVDLKAQYQSIKKEIEGAIENVISETAFIGGKYVKVFEQLFSEYTSLEHVIACANGTDSLEIIMQAAGIKPGDEVLVPAISWISTSEAVSTTGATPVFVDIDPLTYTIDPALIEEKITAKTKAIIPVHLYGHPAAMVEIMNIAQRHNLLVIEDCAQAHGALINDKMVGTFGHASSFSFYPGKNLGAYGDAGAMATKDASLAGKLRMIANHGQLEKHKHIMEGRNSRMDGMQGAILAAKIKHLKGWTQKRIDNAAYYNQLLKGTRIQTPEVSSNCKHVFHLYVIISEKRNELKEHLHKKNIETAIHYPTALPFLDAYASRKYKPADFPVAFKFSNSILSLPMYPELTKEMMEYVVDSIKQVNP
jgi:dTDP-4-amino-4,6-dideoxygalactose transaminase